MFCFAFFSPPSFGPSLKEENLEFMQFQTCFRSNVNTVLNGCTGKDKTGKKKGFGFFPIKYATAFLLKRLLFSEAAEKAMQCFT